ncbi:phage virion morphogenesis protein [Aggregatibacter actinomycetemcomitans]|uniref:phage virion morphogenesis protein n=1 Tax=Aggregatibacter actinomycetemcomitans TaxID=714 RepID=UPI00197C10DF|nr:phage virion morphogenesis protein [Aggregatibacter actinomycetemcomitans]MBN6079894.1 phage virion morphogenesis protein [Aggregatibacter actinomycetemcomitans]
MATVEQIHARLSALINNLSPQARQQLARRIGQQLRKSQQARIVRQQNPDGSKYEPRKQQKLRRKKGRIKRKAMFAKLKTARFLKIRTNANEAIIGFTGREADIAKIHQYGLQARPTPNASYKVQYAQRELLGFSREDVEMIEMLVLEQLAR